MCSIGRRCFHKDDCRFSFSCNSSLPAKRIIRATGVMRTKKIIPRTTGFTTLLKRILILYHAKLAGRNLLLATTVVINVARHKTPHTRLQMAVALIAK